MKNIVIVGAGTAGIVTAARLKSASKELSITIIDPATKHYYQPMWTLVGAGAAEKEPTEKEMSSLIPKGVKWLQDKVLTFEPEQNSITTELNGSIKYDYLVVCPGIQVNWDKIEGLVETLGKNGVCSNYSYEYVDYTYEALKQTKSGNALFTFPNTPIKCGGAPQKIMYLADDFFRNAGVRDAVNVEFTSAGASIFGVEKYKVALQKVVDRKKINTHYNINLEKVDGPNKKAYFRDCNTNEIIEKDFEMLHVGPPQSAPDFVRNSSLVNAEGWVDVDIHTMQHNKYPNIFSLGDVAALPTAKTGAAIRKQAPLMVQNMLAHMNGKQLTGSYNGYSSCPLVTGYGKLILAEFDYDSQPDESFPFNQAKERYSMWILKKYLLPLIYWKGMMKGRM
jgi:sulfide:quinone oxidoreductase